MRLLAIIALVVFVLLPYDAQALIVGAVAAWLATPTGAMFGAGALGALAMGSVLYSWGWNSLNDQMLRDDMTSAREKHKRRRR